MTTPRVAVIGGGLAGLAAAAELRRLGTVPVVFEQYAAVGGVARTLRRDGWLIDSGPAMAAEPSPAVREMLDAAGVADVTVRVGPAGATRFIVLDGAPVPLPRTTSELTSSSLLSIGGRLRLLKERLIPARRDVSDESVDSFARRRFGAEMAERMFNPLIASTSAGDPRQILARYAFPGIVDQGRAGSSLQRSARARLESRRRAKGRPTGSWGCRGGMQQLAERLSTWSGEVRTGTAVQRVGSTPTGIEVSTSRAEAEQFDAVVVAIPATAFGTIRFDLPAADRLHVVSTMPHASIAAVSLGFRRAQVAHPLDGSRLLVPSIEQRDVLSMVFPSSIFPDRAPPDHVLITAFVGGVFRPELMDRSDADLVALVRQECACLLGAIGDPVLGIVSRYPHALPQAVAGHADRIAAADAVERAEFRVAFAGAWRDGLSVGDVLLGGVNVARRLVDTLGWPGVAISH